MGLQDQGGPLRLQPNNEVVCQVSLSSSLETVTARLGSGAEEGTMAALTGVEHAGNDGACSRRMDTMDAERLHFLDS